MQHLRKIAFWYLMLYVLYSVGRSLQTVLTFNHSTDHAIFNAQGLGTLFIACLAITLVLDLASSYAMLRPRPIGFWVVLASLAFSMLYNVYAFQLTMLDLDGTKAAYLASRAARGVPANPAIADQIFTPDGMQAGLGILLFMSVSALGALALSRRRFFAASPSPTSTTTTT